MIHIVFQQADIEALRKSFDLDASMQGEIVQVKDDYAVGPLVDIFTEEGIQTRKEWWRGVLAGGDYDGLADNGTIDDNETVRQLKTTLQKQSEEIVWIWAAQNKHDVSGYYWLIPQLREYEGRIYLLHLHNLPFLNEKGHVFYPVNLFQIPPREFVKAKKLARLITASEFETEPEEWKKICDENRGVRLLEGSKKLVQYDYDFYDEDLINHIGPEWIKASKLIHVFLSKATHTTGDAYLLWRLKELITKEKVHAQGELRNMKDFEVTKTLNA